jgi:DNA replication and repair protein RecF
MVAIIGANGTGKTNILEAISLFTPGRGMRGAETADLHSDSAPDNAGFGITISLSDENSSAEISTGVAGGAARRSILINGETASQNDLREYLSVLWLTPEDDFVLSRGTAARRGLLDRFVSALDGNHHGRLQQLQKSQSERLRILQNPRADSAWLDAVEKDIAERGTAIAAARLNFLELLTPYMTHPAPDFPAITTNILGEIERVLQTLPALQVEENYAAALSAARIEDAERGQTTCGVHRSDWRITHLDKNQPAERCSTGEQKIILFTLFLAVTALVKQQDGRAPILLLDECLSHLDKTRCAAVLNHINTLQSQCFWTGTEANSLSNHEKMKVINL